METARASEKLTVAGLAPRLFANRVGADRARRAGDVFIVVGTVVALALISLAAVPPAGVETALEAIVDALPDGLAGLWSLLLGLAGLWALFLVAATVARQRLSLFRDLIAAAFLAVVVGLVVGRLVEGAWDLVWNAPSPGASKPWVPWLRLSVPVTIIATAAPHLIRPLRTLGALLAGSATIGAILLAAVAPTLALASVTISMFAAAIVHLVLGSTRGWPDLADVVAGLGALGVAAVSLGVVDRQRAGVFRLEATDPGGRRLDVKVYGRDASDTQLLTTFWRRLWFRGLDPAISPGRLQQVEHEAFLTLLAAQSGVVAQPVVIAGLSPAGDAILVLERIGSLVHDEAWDARTAASLWEAVQTLHRARIAHGSVDADHLILVGERVGLVDFKGAVTAPDPWRIRVDHVQALVTSALVLGVEPALDIAIEALGHTGISSILPFLQTDLLTPDQRQALRTGVLDVDALRARAAERVGIEPPELENIRRVTFGTVLRAVLPVLAFFALASVFAGLDIADLMDALIDVSAWFIVVGLIVGQVPRFGQAISTMGASPIPLPLGRIIVLQLAQGYVALTIPGGAARIAVNIRFLQRHGMPSGGALAVGALDSFGGLVSQVILVSGVLTFSSLTLDLDLGSEVSPGLVRLLTAIVSVVVASIAVVFLMPRLRTTVTSRLRQLFVDGRSAFRGLASPRRLGLLLGGNLLTEFLMAVTLGAFALALGYPVGLPELILIHVVVSLLAGILPIPGGIGVVEGGIVLGLTQTGVPDEAAFAIAILFRAATYYLPPIWGFFAFRWLERNKHL